MAMGASIAGEGGAADSRSQHLERLIHDAFDLHFVARDEALQADDSALRTRALQDSASSSRVSRHTLTAEGAAEILGWIRELCLLTHGDRAGSRPLVAWRALDEEIVRISPLAAALLPEDLFGEAVMIRPEGLSEEVQAALEAGEFQGWVEAVSSSMRALDGVRKVNPWMAKHSWQQVSPAEVLRRAVLCVEQGAYGGFDRPVPRQVAVAVADAAHGYFKSWRYEGEAPSAEVQVLLEMVGEGVASSLQAAYGLPYPPWWPGQRVDHPSDSDGTKHQRRYWETLLWWADALVTIKSRPDAAVPRAAWVREATELINQEMSGKKAVSVQAVAGYVHECDKRGWRQTLQNLLKIRSEFAERKRAGLKNQAGKEGSGSSAAP